MNKPKSLVETSEGTTVSNTSPQSPSGKDLLEPISLDFDPMSFEFKEETLLTSNIDNSPAIGEALSPSQNVDVVDFFDPFCPVKEESPTDYYPNVMIGESLLDEPLIDCLSEPRDFSAFNEPVNDNMQDLSPVNDFSESQFRDSIPDYGLQKVNVQKDEFVQESDFVLENDLLQESDLLQENDFVQESDLLQENDFAQESDLLQENDFAQQSEFVQEIDFAQHSEFVQDSDFAQQSEVVQDSDFAQDSDFVQESDFAQGNEVDHEKVNTLENFVQIETDILDEVKDDSTVIPENNISDYVSNSDITSRMSDTTGETEHEQSQSEENSILPETEQTFDYNKHDPYPQHDQFSIKEDDASRRARTKAAYSSKTDQIEKKTVVESSSSSYSENSKFSSNSKKEAMVKEQATRKTSSKTETNGYSSHNGVVNRKNIKNTEYEEKKIENESLDSLASVTDLMSTYVSLTTQDRPISSKEIISTGIDIKSLKTSFTKVNDSQPSEFQEEVKPSVDRGKVQRTFNQNNQDELCLCKICAKHVYQMEKMKAEKSIFHKNCFRCKECNKLLTVDSYSSNEGDIYCKPHFRQLFQPKARFDGEDAAPTDTQNNEGKQRRNEMIIRENVPTELPPDVVRSESKPDHGLANIPVNLSSIKSKFEEYREEHHLPSTTDVCTLQRSASVMARLAKYQSAVTGGEDNAELSESDDEEEPTEDVMVIKPSKHKEKVVFSGMSNLKSQWETGSVAATKEERIEEKKEELNKLRQRICLGRSESMKAVYEKACQDTSKSVASRTEPVELGKEVTAIRLKEKFEKGDLVSEVEEENLEKARREKEEDLSVFSEPGIANDAKKLFKEIDATVMSLAPSISKSPNKSPQSERLGTFHSPIDSEVVKCSEPTEKENIPVDTTDLSQRFKFFENYSECPKERKRFQITPPREPAKEDTPDKEIPRDPSIVRAVDAVDDIPATDTARKMLDKFKALEKESPTVPSGPKPLKRITPPREYTKTDDTHDPSPERDPNIIRSSYKVNDDITVEADKAKSLRAKFENWDTELRDNKRNEDDEEEDFLPQVDTTKTLRAKFESIKEDTSKPAEKPKPKVNRFIQEQTAIGADICSMCGKKVYPMEKMETSGMRIHKNCFRCAHCSCMLRLENYTKSGRNLYCTPHFKQLFISRGNYDEGFGREQHKEKWNRSINKSPSASQDSHENENGEFSNEETSFLNEPL